MERLCLARRRRRGTTMVEYALIAMIVSLSMLLGAQALGVDLAAHFTALAGVLGGL